MMTNADKGPAPLAWAKEITTGSIRYAAYIVVSIRVGKYEWRIEKFDGTTSR